MRGTNGSSASRAGDVASASGPSLPAMATGAFAFAPTGEFLLLEAAGAGTMLEMRDSEEEKVRCSFPSRLSLANALVSSSEGLTPPSALAAAAFLQLPVCSGTPSIAMAD